MNETDLLKNCLRSQANFVLCKLSGENNSRKLAIDLLENCNIYIKDLTGKKCFEEEKFIRLAIRNKKDNDVLLGALRSYVL